MKKRLAFILALVLVFALCAPAASAADTDAGMLGSAQQHSV